MSVILTDENQNVSSADTEIIKDVAALEVEVEHIEEKTEETQEQIVEVETKIEAIEERLEWNSQEKQAIWDSISQLQTAVSETQILTLETLEILKAEQLEEQNDNTTNEEVVIVDIPTLDSEPEPEPTQKRGILSRILFGG